MREHNDTTESYADGAARALAEYLTAAETGVAPPKEQFLARHPELAEELDACMEALRFIGRAAADQPAPDSGKEAGLAGAEPLGDFLLLRELGRGGMGVVYEALQRSLNRKVALKVLPFAAALDARQLQRFRNEAQAAAALHHPHVVPVFGVGYERGIHYYAMQLIAGQTLAAVLEALREPQKADAHPSTSTALAALSTRPDGGRSLSYFRAVARLGVQAADALDHAHQLGVVHRDVKPGNLMLDEAGKLWVTDFGLAQVAAEGGLTMTGDLVGTLRYMSPEQALAKRVPVDHRADVYSLGATLYELLTLRPAVTGSDRQELLRQIAFEEPVPPRQLDRAVPAELETVVLKALEKNPAGRYATARDLVDDLNRFLNDEPILARRPTPGQRVRKWGRRHPAMVAALAAALTAAVVVLGGAIGWFANDRHTRATLTRSEIANALDESLTWQQRRRVPEALSAARRAKAAIAAGQADPILRRRVEARLDDLELLAELEEARLEATAISHEHFDNYLLDRRFEEILRKFHLDIDAGAPEEIASRIRASTVALELASLLDEWAMVRWIFIPQDDLRWKSLLRLAQAADPEPWRTQVRDALLQTDQETLTKLVSADQAVRLPPWTLSAVGKVLSKQGAWRSAETLLRKALQRYPDDFWLNNDLAGAILYQPMLSQKAVRAAEAISFRRVCVALRPQSPGARVSLGAVLSVTGDLDGAIAEFGEALRLKPDYASARFNLANVLLDKKQVDLAIAEYGKAIDLAPTDCMLHYSLGNALSHKKDLDGAITEYRAAIHLNPKFCHAHNGLGNALRDKKELDAAIAEYHEAMDLAPTEAKPHNGLGNALCDKKDVDGAIAEFRKAIDLDPTDCMPHNGLGNALWIKKELDAAIVEYRRAVDLDPNYAYPHTGLGNALFDKKDLDGAIAEYRKTIDLDPELWMAHNGLGNALWLKRDLDAAIVEYRKAIDLDSHHSQPHNGLGNALVVKKDLDGAIAEYRKAIDLDPCNAMAYNGLALALRNNNDGDAAVAEFRKAIAIDPRLGLAHAALGDTLLSLGRFAEAQAASRRGLQLLSPQDGVYQVVSNELEQCKRFLELEGKLPAVLSGKEQPANARERAEYADLCQRKRLNAAAARLYAEASKDNPALGAAPNEVLRYNIACAAALAGCGKGEDVAQLDDAERGRWRHQALDWLRADLTGWAKVLEGNKPRETRAKVQNMLQHWLEDPELAAVRGDTALAKLPEAERQAWQQLWTDLRQLIDRASPAATAPK